jgi:hypothetical protein
MKSKRFTEQQIIELLKQAKAGVPVKELCRKHGFSDAAFNLLAGKFRLSRSSKSRDAGTEDALRLLLGSNRTIELDVRYVNP